MKTLAFSVAVALVVTCCHGGAIPELFDGDQGGTSGGTRPGQNLCGANAIPIPGWMSDSGCTAENCPLGVCDESGKACCYDTSDICESGFPHLRPEGCVPNNCEEGTCASFMIAATSVSVCCQVQTLGGGNQGNQNPCPDGKYLGGRDCNNCKGECVSETTQDGTTREACCVDEDDLPDLPDRDAHCKVVNPACTSDSDCEEAHACRQGKCCWLAMETGTDFSMCKSTEMFIGSAMTDAVGCIMPFAAIIDAKSEDEFCSIMWTGIGCIIENLFSAQNERDICHTYIEDLVKSNPSGILNKVEIIVKGIDSNVDFTGIRGYDASLCPGVFDCKYNERGYDEGDTFPDTEVCNRCGCSANGDIYCTEMACIPNNNADCMVKGQAISSGTNYLHEDGCNVCFCGDGRVKCTDIKRCKRKKDEQDEKDKEEQGGCPPLPLNSFGDCGISECGVNKPCAVGHLCCSNGCGRVCKPDMGACSNVTKMIEFSDTEDAQQCQSYFVEIATMNQNSEQFCRSFWHGVECLATAFAKNDMMVDKYAKDECLRRMNRHVMATGTAALSEIMARVAMDPTLNVQDVNHNPAECTVVKEREDDDMLMKQEDREDQPEYDSEVAAKCANMMEIKAKANQCKREHDEITSSNGYEKKCKAFEKFVECIVGKLFTGANKDEEMRKCIGDLHLFIEKHGDMLKMEFPALANLRVHECLEREHVCGEEMMPLADVMCGAGGGQCPQGSECRGQFCCPAERKGKCPMLRGVPLCDRECEKDEDCQDSHYKCCDQGCGKKTCARLEEEEQSVCQKQFDEAVKNLQQRGICGDGKSSLEIPRCQGTGFAPNQGEYCVKPDGTKIKGSDHFMGNRDCTRVRDGKCPMLEQECRGENIVITNICEHDDDCTNPTEKCCVRRTQGNCLRICTAPETVADNEEVMIPDCPNNEERACCPITSCLGMKCPAHKGAVCKVNSCGGCHVEWFDIDGKKVDNCSEGITPCQQKQAMGMAKNMIARPDMDKLVLFIKGLKEHHSEKKEKDKTEYGDEAKKMDELPMDMYDYEEMSKEDHMKYMSILAEKICKVLNDHGVCMNGGTCALTRPLSERSPYQLCTCPQGYGGLFCEKKPIPVPCDRETVNCFVDPCQVTKCPNHPTASCQANYCGGCNAVFKLPDGTDVTYDCSDCRRNQLYIRTAHTILQTLSPASEVLHKLMTINPPPDYVMPQDIQCDAEGHYSPIQSFVFIPITSDDTVFKTCVNPQSGKTIKRIPNTPIVFAKSMQNLDCTLRQTVDAKELNPKCWLKTIGPCEDASKCQWYYNNDNQRCEPGMGGWEPGSGGHGFSSLNECYDTCKPKPMKKCPPVPEDVMGACAEMCPTDGCPAGQMCCSNGCGHVCKSDLVDPEEPLPCKDKQCDYKTQYCNVAQNEQTGEHEGECRDFQAHCTLDKEEGYGYGKIGAYYFNVKRRVCMRFNYKGMGGNKNRFYSLHQCQTECAMRDYRYKDPVCPAPKLLMVPGMPMPDMCDCDTDCGEHGGVCCSNGHARVCSIPVRSCLNGHRCSFYGFCDEKSMCRCPDCMDSTDTQKVCGSDGQTYDNECKLQKHACKAMKKIVVKSTGECPANPPEPTPEECKNSMVCTMEYMPLCVYDTTDPNNITTHTYSNPCQMMVDKKCNSRTVQVLYPGECQRVCGNCPIYNTECVSGQCGCKADCSLAFDGPVCGHQVGHDQTMTFNSICELRQYGCEKKEIYVISKHGPCDGDKKPEELLECPTMDDDTMMMEIRPGMEQATCDVGENGGFCDAETEKCCRLGQGTHCIPKTKLIRPKVMKEGVCPMISGLNFQRKDCYARKCDDNLSCKGDSICCDNFACGHKTCASPVVKPDVCGVGKFMVPHVKCDADTASGCPDKSDCTEVTRGMHKVHVCCAAAADKDLFTKEVIFKTQLCHELKNIGVECANGGKCDPNLKESKICNCAQGFYGPLCRTNTPPTSNKQCLREKAIMAMLSQKLKDLVDKRIIGDNDDGMDENEDYEAMEGMDHDNDGDVDEHDRELELEYWADYLLAEEQLGLRFVKFLAAKGVKYLLHDVQCDENGDFEHAQCGIMLASHRQKCFCIDKSDWMKHLPGPMAATRDKLDCTMLTNGMDIPEFCKMKPMEGMCESQAGRYYFNPDTADCEEFKDMLCADSNGNNFPSLETCRSFCSSRSWTHKDCKKSCPSGHVCRLVRGKEECKDVTKPKEIEKHFEPKCDKDGKFLPKQCSGTLCTCVQPDDGTVIPNALGSGETLGCVKDAAAQHGIRVTRPEQGKRLVCPDGNAPTKFCEDGGNPCNDCQRTMPEQDQQGQGQQGQGQQGQGQQGQGQQGQGQQGQGQQGQGQMQMHGMMQKQTDEHGVCLECERCPTDQGKKKCPGQCTTACKQNPQATCIVNKCTCKEEFRNSENKLVKCTAAQSQCEKRKDTMYTDFLTKAREATMKRLSGESSSMEDTEEPMDVLHCTENGSYYAHCTGRNDDRVDCYCLDANQFKKAHETPQVVQRNVKPNCDQVQVQTKAKTAIGRLKVAGTLSAWPQTKREKFIEAACAKITRKIPVTCKGRLEEGSVIFVYTLEYDPVSTVEADTSDLASLVATIQSEVNQNEFIFEVDGETYVASEGQVTEFLTAEEVTTTPIDDDDDKKKKETTIIIVVVVVVVVVLLIILATGVYCYRKGKSKQKDIPFDDLQGKSNKAYENPAY